MAEQGREHSTPPRRRAAAVALLALPAALLLLSVLLQRAGTPYWFTLYDPDYAYLLNALNIAEGHAPRHTDHPGTPVQLLGAAVLLIRHALSGSRASLRDTVLTNPEPTLAAIGLPLQLLTTAALAALGFAARRFSGSLAAAMAAQAAVLLSAAGLLASHRIMPEPVLMFCSLLLASGVLWSLSAQAEPTGISRPRSAALLGAITALAVAAKFTFAPAALVAWAALRGCRARVTYLATTAAVLLVLLIPILPQLPRVGRWLWSLAVRDGRYGHSRGHLIINPNVYGRDLLRMIENEPITAAAAVYGLSLLAYVLLRCRARLNLAQRRKAIVLGAAATAQVLQFLIVAKHPGSRYLIPVIGLSGLNLCLLFTLARSLLPRRALAAGAFATVLGLVWAAAEVHRDVRRQVNQWPILFADQVAFHQAAAAAAPPGSVIAFVRHSLVPQHALYFANPWAGELYGEDLARLFPDRIFLDLNDGSLRRGSAEVPADEVAAWVRDGRLLFQCPPGELSPRFGYETLIAPTPRIPVGLYRAKATITPASLP